MSAVWLIPAAVLIVAAFGVARASINVLRRAEHLRVSLTRLGELRAPLGRLADDIRTLGATVGEVRRR